MQEMWKTFPLDTRYEASNLGNLRNAKTKRIRIAPIKQNGYRGVVFTHLKGKVKGYDLHTIVALTWLGPRPPGFDVSHIDGTRLNNAVSNLEYISRKENSRKSFNKHCPAGQRIRLNEKLVRLIRADTELTNAQWGLKLGVHYRNIWKVRKRKTWRYL